MNKTFRKRVLLVSILLIVTLGVWLSLPSSRESPIDKAERMLSIRLPHGTTQLLQEHSGAGIPIPGGASDAVFKMVLIIPVDQRESFAEALAQSDLWQALPISGEYVSLAKFNLSKLEGRTDEAITIGDVNGFFLLHDYGKKRSTKPFAERGTYNFTLGVFDRDSGKLYIYFTTV